MIQKIWKGFIIAWLFVRLFVRLSGCLSRSPDDIPSLPVQTSPVQTFLTPRIDLPNTMVDLPNTILDLPDTMVDLPNTMVDLPDTMVNLPNTMVYLPNTVADLPNTMADLPNTMVDLPNTRGPHSLKCHGNIKFAVFCE